MARAVPLTETQRFNQSAWGAQDLLVLTAVPAAASQALVGRELTMAGALTVAGTYEVLVPLSGMVSVLEVHLTATISAGTVSSALNTLFRVNDGAAPSTWTNKTAGSGAGALASGTRQTSQLTTLRGEQYARLTLTLGGSPNVTFTQAEYNGL
jgi:hypothetical protein